MITSGNKTWRNLQEQVAYLTAMIGQATDVVKNVQGIVATTGDLPAASSFTSGTTYAVGASAPYEYYVAIAGNWVDIGEFPQAGPAGADGENGKAIFLTSEATTSGTIAITAASIYNPDSLSIGKGDLILSDEGNVFAVTGPNSIPGYNVVYRFNIMGPTGATGATGAPGADGAPGAPGSIICYTAQTPASTATTIPAGYVTSDIRTPAAGDMLIASNCNVFEITGVSGSDYTITYVLNIEGAAGAPGADGSNGMSVFATSETTTSSTGFLSKSNITVPTGYSLGAGNLIVSASGDVFRDLGDGLDPSLEGVTYLFNIKGPAGADGAPGAPGADGADGSPGAPGADGTDGNIICFTSYSTSSATTQIPWAEIQTNIRPPDTNDIVISTSGDMFVITGDSGSNATVSYQGNIKGPQGQQGPAGQNGATWYSGTDILYDGQDDYLYLDDDVFTSAKVGDLYLCTSTMILGSGQDTVTVRAGDIYKITELEQMGWKLTYQMNNTALDLNIIAIKVPIIELDGDVDVDIQQVI